jgi:hypothetical protein
VEYILSLVFGQALARGGLAAAVLVLVVFALVAIAAYAAKAKVDSWRQEAATALSERQAREQKDMREISAREGERQALIAEIRAGREQQFKFMENHLAHDRQEREELGKVLSGIHEESRAHVDALKSMQVTLEAHRTESSAGHGALHKRLEDLKVQIAEKGK